MEATIKDGVVFISNPMAHEHIESNYIQVRSLERRVLTNDQVLQLPFTSSDFPHHVEWNLRLKSFRRLIKLLKKQNPTSFLDIGCGNGWLIGQMKKEFPNCELSGIDINQVELIQASQLFGNDQTRFYYLDIISNSYFDAASFDVIIFNASIHYFDNLSKIINIAKTLLHTNGILLVNDSMFYKDSIAAEEAAQRSIDYYEKLGAPEMSNNYFHHTATELIELQFNQYHNWTSGMKKYHFPLFIYSK